MFDRLIESGRQAGRKRTGCYLAGATVIYSTFLVGAASVAIMWFNPGIAEALELRARLVPPIPHVGPPKTGTRLRSGTPQVSETGLLVPSSTTPVRREVVDEPPVTSIGSRRHFGPVGVGNPSGFPGVGTGGVPGSGVEGTAPAPPGDERPAPVPHVAKPSEPSRISEGVLRGRAIAAYTPPYPEIARRVRISGPVQVQVLISEDGRVVEATVLNGHPMLRGTALEAARRWVFSPTKLSGMPVKVQGILTFNFMLN